MTNREEPVHIPIVPQRYLVPYAVFKQFVCIGKDLGHLKLVYRINIIIRTVCQRKSQRSGDEVGRVQENFSFEHLGSMIRILLEVVFLYITYIFFILYYLISDKLLTNGFPNTNIGFLSLY